MNYCNSIKNSIRVPLLRNLLLSMSLLPGSTMAQSEKSPGPAQDLLHTIAALDAALFDAYNRCDLEKFSAFFTEDLEFYHDQTGLSRGRQATVEALRKNICGKTRRELVEGTLEVYPLQGYGAVEVGVHRFCASGLEKCGEQSGVAKFVHLWQHTDGEWRITRVISYDHVSSP